MANRLFIDELTSVGLVDRGDNPGAEVLIYKAAMNKHELPGSLDSQVGRVRSAWDALHPSKPEQMSQWVQSVFPGFIIVSRGEDMLRVPYVATDDEVTFGNPQEVELDTSIVDKLFKASRTFSPERREELADEGMAMPDGSFPIPDKDALGRAIKSIGRTKPGKRAAVMAHIKRRAKALGAADMIPQSWVKKDSTQLGKPMISIPKQGPAPHRTKGVRMPLDLTAVEDEELRASIERTIEDLQAQLDDTSNVEDVAKAQAEKIETLEKRLADETAKWRAVDFAKRASEFEKMLGKPEDIGPVLDALEQASPEAYGKLETALKAAAGRVDLSKLFAEFGEGAGAEADPMTKRDAYVAKARQDGRTESVAALRKEFWDAHPEAKEESRS